MSYTGSFADDFLENAPRVSGKRQQKLEDLRAVLADPAGFRIICGLLKDFGLGSFVAGHEGVIALRNEGERLLRDIVESDSGNAMRVLAAIHGIEL